MATEAETEKRADTIGALLEQIHGLEDARRDEAQVWKLRIEDATERQARWMARAEQMMLQRNALTRLLYLKGVTTAEVKAVCDLIKLPDLEKYMRYPEPPEKRPNTWHLDLDLRVAGTSEDVVSP